MAIVPSIFAPTLAWILIDAVAMAHDAIGDATTLTKDLRKARQPTNLTLYHIHPAEYPGGDLANRNLADLNGALYFDLFEIFEVFMCTDPKYPLPDKEFRCGNSEYTFDGADTVVTEVVVEVTPVDNKLYGSYGTCNPCRNGTSPLRPSYTCHEGEYVCDCRKRKHLIPHLVDCTDPRVGRHRLFPNIKNEHERWMSTYAVSNSINDDDPTPPPQDPSTKTAFAEYRSVTRTWGFWYSMFAAGEGVAWRTVRVTKRLSKACHARSFVQAIAEVTQAQSNNHTRVVSLAGCVREHRCSAPPAGQAAAAKDGFEVTPCWAECLADALLGPNATSMDGYGGGGLNQRTLLDAWARPFRSDDPALGGCPDVRDDNPSQTGDNSSDATTAITA